MAFAKAYAHAIGMKPEEFVARFGAPMPQREFGEKVVSVLDDPKYAEGLAFGFKGGLAPPSNRAGVILAARASRTTGFSRSVARAIGGNDNCCRQDCFRGAVILAKAGWA